MNALIALLTGLVTLLQQMWPTLRDGLLGWVIGYIRSLKEKLHESKTLTEQYKEVLEIEKNSAARPTSGAASRLRGSGWTRPTADKK